MYSRNLEKNTVRASPSYYANTRSVTPFVSRAREEENRYRYNIPPGYVGNRFTQNGSVEETETKHHAAQREEKPAPFSKDEEEAGNALCPLDEMYVEKEEDFPCSDEVGCENEELSPIPRSSSQHPLDGFLSAIKERVTGEDILLVVIILMLALEGENAEITILLLSLLLLVK